ncbi:hypothetical protein SDC9_174687 [bioreactor metagenome]|uniref:Uncharacterized protein n=1 Tax=bioreactor metagenome TaxID=1076179 RepID=A0A645GK28_9ZZZZ
MLLNFLTKYANGAICAATGYYPSSSFAENGGMWVGPGTSDWEDYSTWISGALVGSESEKIRAQTAQVNINYYVNDSENWTKFVDTPFAGSADIRNVVTSGPGYVFLETYGTKGNVASIIDGALNALYASLADYVKK